MSSFLEQIKTSVKLAREQAVVSQYHESLQNYQKAKEIIEKQLPQLSDKSLVSEWKKLKTQIDEEYSVTTQLDNVKKGIQPSPQKKNFYNECPDFPSRQKDPDEKKYPFGIPPFSHHHFPKDDQFAQPQQYAQPQQQPVYNPYNQPLQQQPQVMYQQQQPQHKGQQQYGWQNQNNNNNNIFQCQPQMNLKKGQSTDNIFLDNNNYSNQYDEFEPFYQKPQPNLQNQAPQKDPMVWDPPSTKAPTTKKQPTKKAGQKQSNNQNQQNKQANDRRDYQKPWLVNAAINQPADKSDNKNANTENDFLHHCYPDGQGPDADLIKMLERDVVDKNPNITFDDIAELDKAKDILQEAVLLPILIPSYFIGIRRPWKGVLMFGPPGTGKTMLAKAVATTGKTTFFNVSASSLASKWRGESEKLVRILFEMARFYAPSTVFIDEVDSIGSKRVSDDNEASRRMKAEMLIQMDGLASTTTSQESTTERKLVMVLAATNRPQDLDDALRRRLEKRILIPLPSKAGRHALFKLNMKSIKCDEKINWDELVNKTEGYSGADITNLCREAALMPMRRKLLKEGGFKNIDNIQNLQAECEIPLTQQDFEQALKNINKSVSQDDLAAYDKWMAEFGAV